MVRGEPDCLPEGDWMMARRSHDLLVDEHAVQRQMQRQRAEAHVDRIVIRTEREGVPTVQPSEIGGSALCGVSYSNHRKLRRMSVSRFAKYRFHGLRRENDTA